MASDIGTRRLQRELLALRKDPMKSPKITAKPKESNILEWHYVIEGNKGTPYEGGYYHGKLLFPKEYPLKPPSVLMLTPSGRFRPNRRLCLSMSDFHPESWNPMWSVSTILTGLYSFMVETAPTLGSIETTLAHKRMLARESLDFNVRDKNFCKLFPEYLEVHKQQVEERRTRQDEESKESALASVSVSMQRNPDHEMQSLLAVGAGLVAVLSILFAFFRFLQ